MSGPLADSIFGSGVQEELLSIQGSVMRERASQASLAGMADHMPDAGAASRSTTLAEVALAASIHDEITNVLAAALGGEAQMPSRTSPSSRPQHWKKRFSEMSVHGIPATAV